jgi:hypothetical protein
MRPATLAIAFLAMGAGAAVSQPAPTRLANGEALYRLCTSEGSMVPCMDYLSSVINAPRPPGLYCMPEDTRRLDAMVVYFTFMRDHREYWPRLPADGVNAAYSQEWPCPPTRGAPAG